MKTMIGAILRILVILCFAYIIYCVWTISPFKVHRETDPLGAMVALYFFGFPSLIAIGVVLLIAKRPLRLPWTAGGIPTLYAAPYSLELILKEQHWTPISSFHAWWTTYVYPWTNTFMFLTIAVLIIYTILFAMDFRNRITKGPEQSVPGYPPQGVGSPEP